MVADGLCRSLVRRNLEGHELVTSEHLLGELRRTMERKFGVRASTLPFVRAYAARAKVVRTKTLERPASRDPDDDHVLATAVAARADAILTGDEDLLVLGNYEGTRILSPRQWLEGRLKMG